MDFIAGSWADPATPDGAIENRSPADLSVPLGRHPWAVAQVDRAVAAARDAQAAFAALPQAERAQLVRRIGAVLKEREEELARAIALDVGKPLWEARTEAQACSAKATITVDDGLKLVSTFPAPGQPGAEARFRRAKLARQRLPATAEASPPEVEERLVSVERTPGRNHFRAIRATCAFRDAEVQLPGPAVEALEAEDGERLHTIPFE